MHRNTLLFWSAIHLAIAALAWHPAVAQAQKPADLKPEVQKAIDGGLVCLRRIRMRRPERGEIQTSPR
jgi:hypothetical protein